jgi:hypothetical protein
LLNAVSVALGALESTVHVFLTGAAPLPEAGAAAVPCACAQPLPKAAHTTAGNTQAFAIAVSSLNAMAAS